MESPVGAHLVGSIPLGSAEDVFRAAATTLGDRLRRMPDGETGPRSDWIVWQYPVFSALPQLEIATAGETSYRALPQLRLREGEAAEEMAFGKLGYAQTALASYDTFATLKRDGRIPQACRFLVSLPTPVAPVSAFVTADDQARVEPAYEAGMLEEVRQIVDGIPHDQLAIQWDARYEFAMLEGAMGAWFADVRAGVVERLARLGGHVPAGVELGYHLCYGDEDHGRFVEPADARQLVEVANALAATLERLVDFVHIPVPERAGDAWFAPLDDLRPGSGTELYLGLLHGSDGAGGARRRIEAAREHVDGFGVATECGWGRGGAAAVTGLLELHREVSAPLPERAAAEGQAVWPEGFTPVPEEEWTAGGVDTGGVEYDHVEGHGWYANLDPTVEDLAANLQAGDILLDYSGGTGILLDRLRLRIGDRRVGTVIVDPSPTFLRVALEKFRGDPLVALRLLKGSLEDALGPALAGRGVDAVVSTNAIHLYPDFDAVAATWAQVLKPGGHVYLCSGNVTDPGGRREWLLDQTVDAINDRAEDLVRSDRTYERYEPLLQDRELLEHHAAVRQQAFPAPRALGDYVTGLTQAGLRVTEMREATIDASVHEWFDFLSAFHASVLGWIPDEAVHDRLRLMRQAMEVLFAQRPTFEAGWTYITAEKP